MAALLAAACASAPRTRPVDYARVVRDSVHAVLARGLADSAYPGAYAIIGSREAIYASVGVGHLDWAPSPTPDENTMWDLASLTKVIGTTTATMQLWEQGRIDLDAPVQRYLPNWKGPHKAEVTVRNLLTHTAGLPPFERYYLLNESPEQTLRLFMNTPLDTVPGARMVYSDIGVILLGKIVEKITGEPLDRYDEEHIFRPLGMTSTMYRPPAKLWPRIAPTELDPWRGRLVHGEVHDENAYALGGVSGHAGLFSSAHDLAIFARMMLNGGSWHGVQLLHPATIDAFTQAQDPSLSNRALGWEVPNGTNSAGHHLSRSAFGHTGFTGTSIWIDPERDLFVVLLTNRVDPTRENHKISGVRVALADAVTMALDGARATAALPSAHPLHSGTAP
ncbi:MAG TPA: serine hydrolase [Gemmatimonadaceae bacterium]|nr:serine hydrolase [Gemmatimonadaceae bacterium]